MISVNLIPTRRRERSRRRRRARSWALAASTCAALLSLAYVTIAATFSSYDDQASKAALAKLPREIERSAQALRALRAQLGEAQARLDASRAVAHQPDWAALLALVGQTIGPDVALSEFRLDPLSNPSRQHNGPAAQTAGYRVDFSGLGRTPSAVPQFVLRLEESKLFDQVTLMKTSRSALPDGTVVTTFRVEALIGTQEALPR
jgi:Tfp pilus assembly protein PilN